jgi:hypothetical protein
VRRHYVMFTRAPDEGSEVGAVAEHLEGDINLLED